MGKVGKRQRKFQSTGGVKGRLEKGTISKKGKIRKRKRTDHNHGPNTKPRDPHETEESTSNQRFANDFAAPNPKSLAGLDLDDFFTQASEALGSADPTHLAEMEDDDEEEEEEEEEEEIEESGKGDKTKGDSDKDIEASSNEDMKEEDEEKAEKTRHKDSPKDRKKKTVEKSNPPVSKTKGQPKSSNEKDSSGSDDDSDSDDDDIEVAEQRLKDQMAKLNKSDPEFHEFLQENENSLLEFGKDDEEGMDDEDEETVEKSAGAPATVHLTMEELRNLKASVFERHGIKSLKRLVTAYRCACHLADTSEDKGSRAGESGIHYVIDSSKVYDALMVTCLNNFHEIFRHHLFPKGDGDKEDMEEEDEKEEDDLEENQPLSPHKMENAERWQDVSRVMKSFFSSTLHLMTEAKEPELLTFVLKALSKYMAFLSPFPRLAESMLRNLVEKWSSPLDSSEDFQVVRMNAFFRIRQMAKTQPFPFIETCLRKVYLAYARRAKLGSSTPTVEVLSTLTFMGNSVVEMYSLDLHSSYQHAFVYIRQLALQLRSALHKTSQDAMQQLFRWQFMNCLKLWVSVLSGIVSEEDGTTMRSLIYPLSEIIFGVARLAPSNVRFLPFRLHCVRLLQQLAASTEMFLPTTSLLLDCLDWKEWYQKPKKTNKKSTTAGLNLLHILKLPKDDSLRTHEQQEAAIVDIFVLLEREVDLYAYSAGFPEFSTWIRRRMNAFRRAIRQPRWRKFADGILDLCEKHTSNAVEKRSKLQQAPKDVTRLECLRPVNVPSMGERHKAAIEKEAKRIGGPTPTGKKQESTKETRSEPDDKVSEENETKQAKKKKKSKKQVESTIRPAQNHKAKEDPNVLEQEDDVQEGVDWSDDDNE